MNRAEEYLRIPEDYCRWFGGPRWSSTGDALESATDDPQFARTFAMSAEIALFLEGFLISGSPIGFGFVLHLLHLLGLGHSGTRTRPQWAEELALAFHETGRSLRNAGALGSLLCRKVPLAVDPPELAELVSALTGPDCEAFAPLSLSSRLRPAEVPPLSPAGFESRILSVLSTLSPTALRSWLRHGRGPIGTAGEEVARTLPATLAGALEALEARERISAASPLVAQLDGALALPPRRLSPAELPTGGYSDVSTRGLPEQILPAQLALDGDEFVRRFAERELLYFHREEPHAPIAEELVVVLDQGVRTWGSVRLVLAAALIALGRQAARKGRRFLVSATSLEGNVVDPLDVDEETLGVMLEASDLTPHPGPALARVLQDRAEVARDVVLLTHPRNLLESDVAAASRWVAAGTRLFAVAVDGEGEAQVAAIRQGLPVVQARCRVEAGTGLASPKPPRDSAAGPSPWTGDLESPGFPFRLGILSPIKDQLYDFDESGEWILVAGQHGVLQAWRTDGSGSEMLPRARSQGESLAHVDAVVGVAGGFVVLCLSSAVAVAAHYDLATRVCKWHALGPRRSYLRWSYHRPLHSLVFRTESSASAIDLAVERGAACYPPPRPGEPFSERARQACQQPDEALDRRVSIVPEGGTMPPNRLALRLDSTLGGVEIRDRTGRTRRCPLLVDGQKRDLRRHEILDAARGGDILAVLVGNPGQAFVHVISLSDARPIAEHLHVPDWGGFVLSRDGRRFARRRGDRRLEVRDVADGGLSGFEVPKGRVHSNLRVHLGDQFLTIQAGKHFHLVRWHLGRLECFLNGENAERFLARKLAGLDSTRVRAQSPRGPTPLDRRRFLATCQYEGVTLFVDFVGQVAAFDDSGALICMFFAFRDKIAAWMPDGTRLGPVAIHGGPPTPDAPERIGAALRAAASRAGRVPT